MALTENGLVIESFDEIRESVNARMRSEFGLAIDVSDGAVQGIFIGILAEREASCNELAEAVNSSTDPDVATGARQDEICALTGTQRYAATSSSVTLTLTGDPSTEVAAGSQASVAVTEDVFATSETVELVALDPWNDATAYVEGDRVTNGGNAYEVIPGGGGTSAGSGGPSGTDPADVEGETDGTVLWRFLGEGTAAVDVVAEAVETGPTIATAGSLTTIVTPVAGWSGAVNMLDADLGSDIETNEALRVRREQELARPGSSPLDALRADLRAVDGVTAVGIFENVDDETDGDGLPPHSVECLVQGGEDQDIWDALLASVAAGIKTYGDEIGTAEDSAGNEWEMAFSRPEELDIYVDVELIIDADLYPIDGDDQIKAAIVAYGDAQSAGRDVVASKILAAASAIAGVLDVTLVEIGVAPSPSASTTIAVSLRQLALFDTSRITVATTEGTP